jgi:hypothetical protein
MLIMLGILTSEKEEARRQRSTPLGRPVCLYGEYPNDADDIAFQLTYTTLFGWFASYLFLRTGKLKLFE